MDKLKKPLGQTLIEENLISEEDFHLVLEEQKKSSERLCRILISLGLIDELKLATFLSKYLDIPLININNQKIDAKVTQLIPADVARKYILIPLFNVMDTLTVAMVDPLDYQAIEKLEFVSKKRIEPVVATISDINSMLDKFYGTHSSIKKIISTLQEENIGPIIIESIAQKAFQASDSSGPINKLLHLIISYAIREKASDIHLEPTEIDFQIRFRIDGVLMKVLSLPKHVGAAVTSSIKILAKMDIAEKRVPLDGGFQVKVENTIVDLRVSSFPISEGEKIAVRILNKSNMILNLDELGINMDTMKKILPLINKSHGILLVTGPTGSGKTSSLYSILNRIKTIEKNIVTIEDPIEYRLDMINQTQVNPKAGLTFSKGLRAILRQDPDIILVGEIRDFETAEIAFQAALTGHLVLTTLHTNDAASSITRLIDMGVEPFLVASSIVGVIAQRLVRKICPLCKKEYFPSSEELQWSGISFEDRTEQKGIFSITLGEKSATPIKNKNLRFFNGVGCKECKNSGYSGRMGIFELMIPTERIKQAILKQGISSSEIKAIAAEEGMQSLQEDGINKVIEHKTTIAEVLRVAR
ncbi:MAG: type II secretion system protein GspE [Candidatus Margulisiibacteriota bacterium]|nr:MAG: hypothetical protein A2X43_07730 [Candidatus Margulisbacteria bacterium GWD2_39_127]OGI03887.1 MAG: hypothetical protein A2X42_10005 [Candidatus Margulisbacteria bacterium GWF2_38_17]OGI08808.1 MAG: hypothetical protein A2X41_05110 [Candidatus Margulisbacteria bacterium GWE2_39_32]PZM78639.1 MAG: type II secretion system protein GspE [Candidatus Margulisiibacteriota bacterium]HAR61980.1 type II secretion system protein GspE [Candidatus Margulisiibacteriota bacterium]